MSKYVYITIAKNDVIIVHGSLSYPKRIQIGGLLLTYIILAPNIFKIDTRHFQAIIELTRGVTEKWQNEVKVNSL